MLKQLQHPVNLVLGSVPVLVALTATPSPSIAATFASSSGTAFLYEFSHAPSNVETFADAETFTFANGGSVDAFAESDASFDTEFFPLAYNSSVAEAKGNGKQYFGRAYSEAEVIGYEFLIEAGSTFSFDFLSFLDLETSADDPSIEMATAGGNISFFLFDDSAENIIDYFAVTGSLETAGNGDFLEVEKSSNFTVADPTEFQYFGGNQEFLLALYEGQFSREFEEDTSLTLVEVKTNYAMVKVPEPSSFVAFFIFGVTGVALKKRKQS